MSTSYREGYVRGIGAHLDASDGVDAAAVSDLLVNNCGALFDTHHSHIVNIVTTTGGEPPAALTEPNTAYYVLVGRWPFEPIEQFDGGSALVPYRIGFRRDGGSGSITIGVRIGTQSREPFRAEDHAYEATHTTTSTTTEVVRGTLYVPAEVFNTRHPLGRYSTGESAGAGEPEESPLVRQASFEVWAIHTGTKPTVALDSVHARQVARAFGGVGGIELREDGDYELREDGGLELRE